MGIDVETLQVKLKRAERSVAQLEVPDSGAVLTSFDAAVVAAFAGVVAAAAVAAVVAAVADESVEDVDAEALDDRTHVAFDPAKDHVADSPSYADRILPKTVVFGAAPPGRGHLPPS